jgi:transcriptional regulator with XRE-family HTH domain
MAPEVEPVTTAARRTELGTFLRSRRGRITPTDLGLPPGLRRRTPGLRREEVAQLAGVGVTWYTWLEQGRSINASVQVLDAIARTLRLDRAEREHLYRLAEVPAVLDAPGECLEPEVQAILDGLDPLPAVVYNGRYDALAWNATYAGLFPGITRATRAERNVLWQMFMMPECCAGMVNREAERRTVLATFRGAYGRHLREPAWNTFIDRLSAESPEFAAMWAMQEVAEPTRREKVFYHRHLGRRLHMVATSFAVSATPETRMVVYTPVSEADQRTLAEVASLPPLAALCPVHAAAAQQAQALATA